MNQRYLWSPLSLGLFLFVTGCGEDNETQSPITMDPAAEMLDTPTTPTIEGADDSSPSPDESSLPEAVSEEPMPAEGESLDNNDVDVEADGLDIAEILESDPRFSEVLELVNIIGLLDAMRGPGPFTVFVPINDAIYALPDSTMDRVRDETGFLHQFILAHVAEGDHSTESLVDQNAVEMIGGDVRIEQLSDGGLLIGGAEVLEADIQARNGRLHALNQVIPIPTDADHSESP